MRSAWRPARAEAHSPPTSRPASTGLAARNRSSARRALGKCGVAGVMALMVCSPGAGSEPILHARRCETLRGSSGVRRPGSRTRLPLLFVSGSPSSPAPIPPAPPIIDLPSVLRCRVPPPPLPSALRLPPSAFAACPPSAFAPAVRPPLPPSASAPAVRPPPAAFRLRRCPPSASAPAVRPPLPPFASAPAVRPPPARVRP